MKIILLQDVAKVGRKYDIKNVSDGFFRNFLLPRKLAEIATLQTIKSIEIRKKQSIQEIQIQKDILEKNIASLEGVKISIKEKTNEKGHLFAGVHKEEISKILKEQKNLDIPSDLIELDHPIKEVGEYKIKVGNKEFVLEITN